MSNEKSLEEQLKEAADMLEKLVDKFDSLGWNDHASYIQNMASHLIIYIHQIKAKVGKS